MTLKGRECPSTTPQSQGELKTIKGEAAQQDAKDTQWSLAKKKLYCWKQPKKAPPPPQQLNSGKTLVMGGWGQGKGGKAQDVQDESLFLNASLGCFS